MKCKLCESKEANKKNTHYLTDSVIRSCLNEAGENIREKGLYFDISNDKAFVGFNFQRNTSITSLQEVLGREPNDAEIENAKAIPYSVDYVFCSDCEKKFTIIEEIFIKNHLDYFRNQNFNSNIIEIHDILNIKIFFLLQIWRSNICEEIFQLNDDFSNKLRQMIYNYPQIDNNEILSIPISVSYLMAENKQESKTTNIVGFTSDQNPYIIFLNDFIIQFFDDVKKVKYFDFYELNDEKSFTDLLNINSNTFKFKILNFEEKSKLINNFMLQDYVKRMKDKYKTMFINVWFVMFRAFPNQFIINEYLSFIAPNSDIYTHFTQENIMQLSYKFIKTKISD